MSHRSQSNLSALSLFDRAVSLELHLDGIKVCAIQAYGFNNSTMLNDTIADIGESKSYPKGVIHGTKEKLGVLDHLKAAMLACSKVCADLVNPTSKKDTEALSAMDEAIAPIIATYGDNIGPIVDKRPAVKTEAEKAAAKQKSADSAAEKSAAWAKENGWISPEDKAKVDAGVQVDAEIVRLNRLVDEAREETARVSTILAEKVTALAAALHSVSTLQAENLALQGQIDAAATMPTVAAPKARKVRAVA